MRFARPLSPAVTLVRPALEITRAEVTKYLETLEQERAICPEAFEQFSHADADGFGEFLDELDEIRTVRDLPDQRPRRETQPLVRQDIRGRRQRARESRGPLGK